MANIGNGFKLDGASDTFSTQNSKINFALIYSDYNGNIIEIESYDTSSSSNSLGAEYPKKLIITRQISKIHSILLLAQEMMGRQIKEVEFILQRYQIIRHFL